MKRFSLRPALFTAATLVCGTGLVACKDFLTLSPSAYNTATETFSTADGATAAAIGAYDMLSGDAAYGNRLSSYYPFDSDEMVGSIGASDAGRRGISRYSAIASNSEITNPWNMLYQGIERANICIANIPKSPVYTSGSAADKATMQRLLGEMLTLRAQYYFELVRNWGDVPEPRTPSVTGQDFQLFRTDRDTIYTHLVKDLAFAQTLMPWRSAAGSANERFTKGSAKGLRARIALYRGGYSLAQDGTERRASDYLTYYGIARQECLDLMANQTQHALNTSFEATFRSIANIDGSANNAADVNHEIIMAVGNGGATAQSDSKLGYYNGPRLTASPTYGTSSGAITIVPTYFYAFDSLDTRRDVTITPYVIGSDDAQKGTTLLTTTDGKYRRDWRSPALSSTTLQSLSFDWILLRYADIPLMFAEAENEINGPTQLAVDALMSVRRRGYGANSAKAPLPPTTSKAAFFTALTQERFVEFGGEGIRKYDLIRWNLMTAKINQTRADITDMIAGTGTYGAVPLKMFYTFTAGSTTGLKWVRSFYKPSPATTPTGSTAVNWALQHHGGFREHQLGGGLHTGQAAVPIPQSARDTDSNLTQNFGYQPDSTLCQGTYSLTLSRRSLLGKN